MLAIKKVGKIIKFELKFIYVQYLKMYEHTYK